MEILGITKWIPDIHPDLAGNVWYATRARTLTYDIQNIKAYPNALIEGEAVVVSEKVHGSCAIFGSVMDPDPVEGDFVVQSKGIGGKGLALKVEDPVNANNLYVRTARDYDLATITRIERDERGTPVYVLGEVFGQGVQDLTYGASTGQKIEGFRVFDVFVGTPQGGESRFLNDDELETFCARHRLPRVPVLYRGPYRKDIVLSLTNGKESVSGTERHIREGVVVRTCVERKAHCGRLQFKSVSEAYLLRKDGTEYT
jgi:RNA ligase (TIGR02306 family)